MMVFEKLAVCGLKLESICGPRLKQIPIVIHHCANLCASDVEKYHAWWVLQGRRMPDHRHRDSVRAIAVPTQSRVGQTTIVFVSILFKQVYGFDVEFHIGIIKC